MSDDLTFYSPAVEHTFDSAALSLTAGERSGEQFAELTASPASSAGSPVALTLKPHELDDLIDSLAALRDSIYEADGARVDFLKYVVHLAASTLDWVTEQIGASELLEDSSPVRESLCRLHDDIRRAIQVAGGFGNTYRDGRPILVHEPLESGNVVQKVNHPTGGGFVMHLLAAKD